MKTKITTTSIANRFRRTLALTAAAGTFTCAVTAFAETSGGNIFLQGDYVEIGIHPSGSFGTSVASPAGFNPQDAASRLGFVWDSDKDGWNVGTPVRFGDAFLPGNPEEGWAIEWTSAGGGERTFGNFGLRGIFQVPQTSFTETTSGDLRSAVWEGEATNGNEKLKVIQTVRVNKGDLFFVINVTMINTGTVSIDSVEYMRNVDPDHEQPSTGDFTTINWAENDLATGQQLAIAKGRTYGSIMGLGTIDSRATVSLEGFSNRNPDDIIDSPVTPTAVAPATADAAMALAYRFGTLAPGQSVSFDYAYILRQSDLAVALGNLAAVTILQPTGSVSGSNVLFQTTTNNIPGTTKVEFFVNNVLIATDLAPDASNVFETSFSSIPYANGVLNLKAVATFSDGRVLEKTTTVTVDNSGAPVTFVTPLPNTVFSGTAIPVEVAGTEAAHPPVRVSFFRESPSSGTVLLGEDTEAPFTTTFSVAGLPGAEPVIIKAVAADAANRLTTIQVGGTTALGNVAPTDITLLGNSIAENNAPGATIGTLTATDEDASQTHTFSLVSGVGDNSAFTIDGNTLSINGSADFEAKNSYTVRIRATDSGAGNLTFEKDFSVTISDVSIPQVITFDAPSNVPVIDDVVLTALGGGSGNPVTFSIVSGPATLSGDTLSFTGIGPVVVRASQAGAGDYLDAVPVEDTITADAMPAATTGKTYTGLLTDSSGNTRGSFLATLGRTGYGSVVVWLDGRRGGTRVLGQSSMIVIVGGTPMSVSYTPNGLGLSGDPTLLVSVNTGSETLNTVATRSPFETRRRTPNAGKYTFAATAQAGALATDPQVGAVMTGAVSTIGSVRITARFGNGRVTTFISQLQGNRRIQVYCGYGIGGTQSLSGALAITSPTAPQITGKLRWSVPAGLDSRLPSGVDADYNTIGARFTAGLVSNLLALDPSKQISLELEIPTLSPSTQTYVFPMTADVIPFLPARPFGQIRFFPSTGMYSGTTSFGFVRRNFYGVLLQGASLNYGVGYFEDVGGVGAVTIQPASLR